MTYMQYSGNKGKIRICVECGKEFIPHNHGGTKQFCSYHCSNKNNWKRRERKPLRIRTSICTQCNKEFQIPYKYSLGQWNRRKYCSIVCAANNKKIKDGMDNSERFRRKRGSVKMHTHEWIEKIRARTSEAMMRPETNQKLHKQRASPSLETRIKHSNALAGRLPKNMMYGDSNSGCYTNVQRGYYENSKGTIYFRSKWEANYALYLDFLVLRKEIRSWEYEVDTFIFEQIQFGTRSYLPDFKVFNNNGSFEYHEVKGYMDSKSKVKLKRMAKYYPDVKIILIDSEYYRDLVKKVGKMLNFN